ncbi:MAG: EFR1 family ferrodoxin [Paramuribaculum sp.]|nr:EFR1 family ferrodoxin [Paramuribaculum sp.]
MILFFSGTGNSRAVAKRLSRNLGDSLLEIDASMDMNIDASHDERIVWCFPVHAWDMPELVRDVLNRIQILSGEVLPHFMVATCGDDIGKTHLSWRAAMKKRKWNPVSAFSVIMPNTYVLLPGFDVDTAEVRERKLEQACGQVDKISRAIKCHSNIDNVTEGTAAWLKSRVLSPLFKAFLMSPRPFHATDKCIGCGKCMTICPMNNIDMLKQENHPIWHDKCTMCLGCYHVCPCHAVAYGKATRKKGQSYLSVSEANIVAGAT